MLVASPLSSPRGAVRGAASRVALLVAVALLSPFATPACAMAPPPTARDTMVAVLWVQTAAEYEIAVRQSYRLALRRLDAALAAAPDAPAVVVDLDETLLDNSAFEARLLARDAAFDMDAWRRWLSGTEARALPGAVDFVRAVRRRGVAVFIVTNRPARYRTPTLATLRATGLLPDGDDGVHLLLVGERPGWTTDKTSRREHAARDHTVVLIVGNDLNDFVAAGEIAPDARRRLAAAHADRFAHDWVLVPSPAWGGWLDALHDHRHDLTAEEQRARRLSGLRLD